MKVEKTVIALGFFDGVHRGHGALLRKAAERAGELNAAPAVFTFDRSPKEFVTGKPVLLINSNDDRRDIIRRVYGIQRVIFAPFDREMMTMPWQDFITELLVKQYGAVHLVAGHDYRFGHKNEGTVERLREKCRELGLGCDIIPKVELEGITVSSTYIRTLLEDIAAAMGQKGTMSALRRTSAGVYTEADAHTLEEILAAKEQGLPALEALMLPVESVFESLPLLVVEPRVEQHLYNGCPTSRYPAADGRYRVRNAAGQFLGLANIMQGVLRVEKLFIERN